MPSRRPRAALLARAAGIVLACSGAALGHAQVASGPPAAGAAAEPPVVLTPVDVRERLPERGVEPAALGSVEMVPV
jgi:hypothetical protein